MDGRIVEEDEGGDERGENHDRGVEEGHEVALCHFEDTAYVGKKTWSADRVERGKAEEGKHGHESVGFFHSAPQDFLGRRVIKVMET